jgi:hypothetical protein
VLPPHRDQAANYFVAAVYTVEEQGLECVGMVRIQTPFLTKTSSHDLLFVHDQILARLIKAQINKSAS